jgi:hypothetical protein
MIILRILFIFYYNISAVIQIGRIDIFGVNKRQYILFMTMGQ